jgi:DNA ligase-1
MNLSDVILKEIDTLRSTSGKKAKERLLKKCVERSTFKKILYYTYSPYRRFHIRKIPTDVVGRGFGELSHETWVLLNKLSFRKMTGVAARESLFEHIEYLNPSAGEILKMIIRKDLKAGVATKTINKIAPGLIPTFECQLVEEWVDNKVKWPILIAPKIDGTRGEKRGATIYTRSGHPIVGLDHIIQYLDTVHPTIMTSGELWVPGMPFRRSDGLMRSNKPEKPNARYALFDIPSMVDAPLKDRITALSKSFYPLESNPLPPVCFIPHAWAHNMDEVDAMYNLWRSKGYEGLVGKDPNSLPYMGRNHDWMRRVPTISAEYLITGVYESEERPGFMGGVIIQGGIKVGSGFSDAERLEYLHNPHNIIGRYGTIEAKEKTVAGSLRQPIFKAVRWDIPRT